METKPVERGIGNGVAELNRVKLALCGADRVRYLNGQVTSNVTRLGLGHSQPACVTTAKGRLCAEIRISAFANELLIDADPTLAESLPTRLERYMVADEVTLELRPELHLLHFLSQSPAELPGLTGLPLLAAERFGLPGWDLWLEPEQFETLWPQIQAARTVLSPETLESLRIERGIPIWGAELNENTLPPEAGLDRTHIDYSKGCYIGQEVISRIKSVGHVNRQLVSLVARSGALHPGDSIFSAGAPEQVVGTITSASWSFALEKSLGLGYLKRGVSHAELEARSPEACAPLIVRELPLVS